MYAQGPPKAQPHHPIFKNVGEIWNLCGEMAKHVMNQFFGDFFGDKILNAQEGKMYRRGSQH